MFAKLWALLWSVLGAVTWLLPPAFCGMAQQCCPLSAGHSPTVQDIMGYESPLPICARSVLVSSLPKSWCPRIGGDAPVCLCWKWKLSKCPELQGWGPAIPSGGQKQQQGPLKSGSRSALWRLCRQHWRGSADDLWQQPAPLSSRAPPDPAPLDTAHSCLQTPDISQKERGAGALSKLHSQTTRSRGLGPCQTWLHPCCWSSFWFPPGLFLLLPPWWWLSPNWSVVWARPDSLVSAGKGCIFPVLWDPGKCVPSNLRLSIPMLHQSPKGEDDKWLSSVYRQQQ